MSSSTASDTSLTSPAHSTQAALTLAALGVVYGDIGTSPLYALKEVFASSHAPVPITEANVLGVLSLFFWSLMVVVTLKYVWFILRANNRGEGGIMALMTLALQGGREGTWTQRALVVLGLCGAAFFYGDGVVTPAISVLSAVEGLELVTPAFQPYIVPLSIAIIVGLFMVQRRGTAQVGAWFGPIMVLWFVVLALLGLRAIVVQPEVLRALDPSYALGYWQHNPMLGFLSLGSVVLCLTGAEALYADMGHFGIRPIRRGWMAGVMPSLVLNYFGQGALLLSDPATLENPFYLLAPEALRYPLVALATVATVIASQAVISGAFSMSKQAMQLGYTPRLDIRYTSSSEMGQIYVPAINSLMLVVIVALILGFQSSGHLAAAYGIAVTGTMLITNVLAIAVALRVWRWHPWRAVLGALPFLVIDGCFFAANSLKIRDGGWFPLVFGAAVFVLFVTWKRGRELLHHRLAEDALPLEAFAESLAFGGTTTIEGTAVFLCNDARFVPQAMLHSLKHFKALHAQVLVVSVRLREVPQVPASERVCAETLAPGFWRVFLDYGFKDDIDLPQALAQALLPGVDLDPMQVSYFLGRETLIPRMGSEMAYWRELLFVALFRNAGSATAFYRLPSNRVIELGSQVVL